MITLTQLEYAVAVDTYRHFGKAAKACHVTQPTLSMQLQKLEEDLGVVLFDRSKKPILVMPLGIEIISQARLVLNQIQKIRVISSQGDQMPQGNFVLGVIPTLAPYLLPRFLPAFMEHFPKVALRVREMQTSDILDALDKEEIDAGLLATPLDQDGFFTEVLFYEPFYVYVGRSHELANKKKIEEGDLDAKNVLLLEEGHCFRSQVIKLCGVHRESKQALRFESGTLETLKGLVQGGLGYTLIPYLAIGKNERQDEEVEIIAFAQPAPSREISLVYRRDQLKKPVINALAGEVKTCLPPMLKKIDKEDIHLIGI